MRGGGFPFVVPIGSQGSAGRKRGEVRSAWSRSTTTAGSHYGLFDVPTMM